MSETKTARNGVEKRYFLTELIGARAYLAGKKIGKLTDVIVVDRASWPRSLISRLVDPSVTPRCSYRSKRSDRLALGKSSSTSRVHRAMYGGFCPEKSR